MLGAEGRHVGIAQDDRREFFCSRIISFGDTSCAGLG